MVKDRITTIELKGFVKQPPSATVLHWGFKTNLVNLGFLIWKQEKAIVYYEPRGHDWNFYFFEFRDPVINCYEDFTVQEFHYKIEK